jgi:mannitol/fructose-specific phosphotransferase system IIA component (Ntr-type)
VGAIVERENVMPSAIGNGIAFLHTLHRNPEQVIHPFMVLGRSTPGVDFDSLDSEPTHLFFVLGLKYTELHLPWLQKLSQILIHSSRVKAILTAPDAASIYLVLSEAERNLLPLSASSSFQPSA